MKEKFLPFLLTGALISSSCARPPKSEAETPNPEPTPSETQPNSETITGFPSFLAFPLFTSYSYLLNGPHNIARQEIGVKYAIDLASKDIVHCNGERVALDVPVLSASDGTVTIAGGKERFDQTWSIVEIDTGINGFSFQYIHLDNIKVVVGQKVEAGDELGDISCEYPKGGYTDGVHLHFGIKKDGKPYRIHGLTLAGWEISEGPRHGDGTMKQRNPILPVDHGIRVADGRRCGPTLETIEACGGIRNDLPFIGHAKPGVKP